MLAICESPFLGSIGMAKRFLDLAISVAILPVLLPLLGIIALLIKLTSPGPAIFKQRRYGLGGEEITVLKFRTMKVMEDGNNTYKQVTRADDRVTPLGRVLRKTSLDELPQLLNVLGGSMSLVGPRPHALAVNEQFRQVIPGYMVRHKVKPGITGWAQVNGCRGGDDLESMKRRTAYDLEYLRSWTLALDLVVIWKTAVMLVRGDKNAY
jgi:putative colanic acid biosynthesis UDP-glucose lipid carrier transferase